MFKTFVNISLYLSRQNPSCSTAGSIQCALCVLQHVFHREPWCALKISLHKVTFLLYFSHRIQHRGHQLLSGFYVCRRLKCLYSHAAVACRVTERRQDRSIDGQRSSTQHYHHKQATPPIRLEKIKRNRKIKKKNNNNCAKQCINYYFFCSTTLNTRTSLLQSKVSGRVFTLTGGKAPTSLAYHHRNTA